MFLRKFHDLYNISLSTLLLLPALSKLFLFLLWSCSSCLCPCVHIVCSLVKCHSGTKVRPHTSAQNSAVVSFIQNNNPSSNMKLRSLYVHTGVAVLGDCSLSGFAASLLFNSTEGNVCPRISHWLKLSVSGGHSPLITANLGVSVSFSLYFEPCFEISMSFFLPFSFPFSTRVNKLIYNIIQL